MALRDEAFRAVDQPFGAVVLRRLADALQDGDPILALVKGSAINNDGSRKVGYLAPSVDGHADVVREALSVSGVSARDISLVDAHGTGTAVGDPIEVAALTEAFRTTTSDTGFCRLGSTKPNIGHLDTAAGVASVIKVNRTAKPNNHRNSRLCTCRRSRHRKTSKAPYRLNTAPDAPPETALFPWSTSDSRLPATPLAR
jgi:acyl transferase domain-containing protein